MHPDKKVGLALGILLIGITGAFFFRNDAHTPHEETLTLTDPESLDRKVSQKPGAPYFPEETRSEVVDNADLAYVPDSSASVVVPNVPQVDSSGYRGIMPSPINNGSGPDGVEQFADRIAPLPVPGQDLDRLDNALSDRATGSGGISPSGTDNLGSAKASTSGNSGSPKRGFITHKVVAGDNLSKLAEKYLGSHSKYLNLYEANRDQLASPDDLSPGMELKIPQGQGSATTTSARSTGGQSTSSIPRGTDSTVKQQRKPTFVKPDHKSVIALGGGRRNGRKLSQAPPPGLPRVEGLDPGSDPAVIASRPE